MKTSNWETLKLFESPVDGTRVKFVDSPLETPDGVDEAVRSNWNGQLVLKREQLLLQHIDTEIRPPITKILQKHH